MVPNTECRHVGNKKGPDFLTRLYPAMGGQVRSRVLSSNNENLSSGDGGPRCGRERAVGDNGDEGKQQHPGDEDWGVEHGAGLGLEHQP